ncbi:DUF3597 domain-containing protein [Rhodoligotrophos defluvii]|uniref:DUF3597 domain-containing protein n=1 Tax=Rhodoligotrophos defluvii TaxID=2561934 RepID=UPI0010C991D5|nr:DUF3597 domain-containing protein [Rhodoligotrophos defluvii]
MGILDSIKNTILGDSNPADALSQAANAAATETAKAASAASTVAADSVAAASQAAKAAVSSVSSSIAAQPTAASGPSVVTPINPQPAAPSISSAMASAAPVDVASILDAAVKQKGEMLDWRNSIVDMMKALGLDSSFSSRMALAKELNYPGDLNDSAAVNTWLHKTLMAKLAENGGKMLTNLLG